MFRFGTPSATSNSARPRQLTTQLGCCEPPQPLILHLKQRNPQDAVPALPAIEAVPLARPPRSSLFGPVVRAAALVLLVALAGQGLHFLLHHQLHQRQAGFTQQMTTPCCNKPTI